MLNEISSAVKGQNPDVQRSATDVLDSSLMLHDKSRSLMQFVERDDFHAMDRFPEALKRLQLVAVPLHFAKAPDHHDPFRLDREDVLTFISIHIFW